MAVNIEVKVETTTLPACPFKRASPPIERPPPKRNGPKSSLHYSKALRDKLFNSIEELPEIAHKCSILVWSFRFVSTLGAVGYLGFNAYLLHLYKGDGNVAVHSVLFAAILCYTFINASLILSYADDEIINDSEALRYWISLFAYLGLSTASIVILFRDGYNIYGNVSCILFAASIYGPGVYTIVKSIIAIIWLVIAFLEFFFRRMLVSVIKSVFCFSCWKSACAKEEAKVTINHQPYDCSLYYYDKSKTTMELCTICLCNFENKETICVGKCHLTHIFHAQCLGIWLENKKSCPICTSTSGFR